MAQKAWLNKFLPTWAWFLLLAICWGIAAIVGKSLHPEADQVYRPPLATTEPDTQAHPYTPSNSSAKEHGSQESSSAECDAAIEALRQIDDAQLTRANHAEENESKRLNLAVRQGEDALRNEVDREEMQDAARDVAQRREREPAVRRVEEACKLRK